MNPNSPKPGHLFFTPRTPWGTRAGQRSFQQHMSASEDAPDGTSSPAKPPKRIGTRIGQILAGARPFAGVEGEKESGTGEPPSVSGGVGVHFGPGEPSTGEDPRGENSDWQNQRLHVNEPRTNQERMKEQEPSAPKSPAQQQAEWVDRKTRESYARFLESQKKAGNARP